MVAQTQKNKTMTNLSKQLAVDKELSQLFEKYHISETNRPYGVMRLLVEQNASLEEIETLLDSSYYYSSLQNHNTWQ